MLTLDFDKLELKPGDRVLDIGCGYGRHSYEVIRRGGRAVALDLSDTELKDVLAMFRAMASEEDVAPAAHGSVCNANALQLPFADATFDHVIASEVLEHIPLDTDAMAEIARVVRPGGSVTVTVPRTGQEIVCWTLSRDYHDTPGGHVRIYRQSQLKSRLASVGLRPLGIGFAHALHTPYWWLRCLVGPRNEENRFVRAYKAFLEWDIMTAPPLLRLTERVLNPVLGKSLVVYSEKPC
jgi:SAM-dependent methyltransferase